MTAPYIPSSLRPPRHELRLPRPSPKQLQMMTDQHKYVGYGGARGGGKSYGIDICAAYMAYKYPGIRQMIVRKTYPELQANHIIPLRRMLHCYDKDVASYHDGRKEITVYTGGDTPSVIMFRYCDAPKDLERFQGQQTDILYLDEATQHTEEVWQQLKAIVRGVNPYPKRFYLTCNPGGPGMGWFRRLFINRDFRDGEDPSDYSFIQSLVTDNKALMIAQPDYVKQLESLPPKLRAAWLEGSWDTLEGQFFEDFRATPDLLEAAAHGCRLKPEELKAEHRWTHVISPIDLTTGDARKWRISRSYDFGYAKPFSCAWWATDYDGTIYRILELYGCTQYPNDGIRWTPDEQFLRIAQIERDHPWLAGKHIDGVADPSIWDTSRGESIADTASKYGIYFTPGDNHRIAGWMQVHYRFQFDDNGYARMYIFDTCKAFLRTIPLMMFDEHKPEDLDTKLEDHVSDETRYMCMQHVIKPMRDVPTKTILTDPLNQFTDWDER